MKQIKFRAWDTEGDKHLYSGRQDFICTTHRDGLGVTIPFKIDEKYGPDVEGIDWADADLISGRYELEQFTGLKDKKGREIYEGDILSFDKDFDDTDNTFIVFFDEKISAFNFRIYGYRDYISESGSLEYESFKSVIGEMENLEREDMLFYLEYVSVVGNIHENKDLM